MRELSVGSVVAGHRIEELLARGGMGVVYRVTHIALQRERALKLIAPELAADEDFRVRFKREWRLAASIDHPHAIPIHDAGEEDGVLYIAMRYVDGTDLRAMTREGPLEPDVVATLVNQVAGALDAAHARGLIHRDIKPANILVERHGDEFHAYLTDFGLSKHLASAVQLTDEGRWVGTVDYVAPEQIEGRPLDARTDVYALGCVAFQCLAAEVPYPRDRDVATIWAHLNAAPPSLRDRGIDAPEAFDEIVGRATAKAPEARYPSAGDLGRALLAAAQGEAYAGPERSVAKGDAAPGGASRTAATRVSRRRMGWKSRRIASVGVGLAFLLTVAVLAIVLSSGGGDQNPVLASQELAAYQRQVGRLCDDYHHVNKVSASLDPGFRRALRRAKNYQQMRDAVISNVQYGIRSASDLSSRLAGFEPPNELEATQRSTVRNWQANVSVTRDYRDELKRVTSYDALLRVTARFDRDKNTRTRAKRSERVLTGLTRLGEASCDPGVQPPTNVIRLPPDPEAGKGSRSNGGSGGGGAASGAGSGGGSKSGGSTSSTSSTSGGSTTGGATTGGATTGGATTGGATTGGATTGGATTGSASTGGSGGGDTGTSGGGG